MIRYSPFSIYFSYFLLILTSCSNVTSNVTQETNKTGGGAKQTPDKIERRETNYNPPRIGSTIELEDNNTCKKENLLAYVKTKTYTIYICGKERDNKPSFAIIRKENSYQRTITENPRVGWNRSYKFGSHDFELTIERPTRLSRFTQKDRGLLLRLFVLFANDSFINERIEEYLFNEKAVPAYLKTTLEVDRSVGERFMKLVPEIEKHFDVCKFASNNPPKSVEAYEISNNKYLIEATCIRSRNKTVQYFLYSELSPTPTAKPIPIQTLKYPESGRIELQLTDKISGLSQFFPEDNILRMYSIDATGGCGYAAEYKLDEDRFRLQEFRKYDDCTNYLPPEEFPRIYP